MRRILGWSARTEREKKKNALKKLRVSLDKVGWQKNQYRFLENLSIREHFLCKPKDVIATTLKQIRLLIGKQIYTGMYNYREHLADLTSPIQHGCNGQILFIHCVRVGILDCLY